MSSRREFVFLRERTVFIFEGKVVILDLGEIDKYSLQILREKM
jgi:predicted ATPase